MSNPWLFDVEHLENTPSRRDNISKEIETNIRTEGGRFIKRLGDNALSLHYSTVATGAVFFHRFYMFHSFRMFPVYPMAATCLFLAGKVEETPKKSSDIVRFSKAILSEQDFSQFGADPKEEILTLERILLQTLRFDLEVEHPYPHLITYHKHMEVVRRGHKDESYKTDLLQSAWTFLNDSCCTTVCLQYEPEIVAIAMLLLACKTCSFEIIEWENKKPEHKHWWEAYVENLDEATLEAICHSVLDVYQFSQTLNRTAEQTVTSST